MTIDAMHRPCAPAYEIASGLDYPAAYTQAGQGELLLLIHGSLCDYRYWRWQVPALSQHYRVVAPSLRGYWPHALTHKDPAFNVAQHTRDLIALVKSLAPGEPVHVLGHSRGAQIALEFALSAPELTRTLTLADPGFPLKGEIVSPSFQGEAVRLLERGQVDQALEQFVDAVNGPGTWKKMVGWFKTMVKDNAYTLLSQVRQLELSVDPDRVRQLDCPVLLVGGADSPTRYASRQDALERVLSQVSRVIIAGASHGMNLAKPQAFNQAILTFLQHRPMTQHNGAPAGNAKA